jgi:sterol desaturase/sphingolipid hydroxylase (fatty acid hydroxylase superfamily)
MTEALLAPILDPASRTWWPSLITAAALAVIVQRRRGASVHLRGAWSGSSQVDLQLLLARQLLAAAGAIPTLASAWWIASHLARGLDRAVGPVDPAWLGDHLGAAIAVASLVLFVVGDASRFLLHLALHRVPALWRLHQVHHSAEVLTPLTWYRVHPLEAALYEARGAIVTGVIGGLFYWLTGSPLAAASVLGVHGLGVLANLATGNLRHSHVWLRFGEAWERWLLSPAQHQLHHAEGSDDRNLGVWLAIWDRAAGTWTPAGEQPPERFGLPAHARHHAPDDLLGALLGPLRPHAPARTEAPS